MSAFKHFMKIDIVHKQVKASGGLLSRVQRWGPRAKTTPCGTGLCFYRRRQAANRQYKFNVDGDWLAPSGSGPCMNGSLVPSPPPQLSSLAVRVTRRRPGKIITWCMPWCMPLLRHTCQFVNFVASYQQLSLHQLHHCHPSQLLLKRFFGLRDVTRSIYHV